MTQIEVSFRDTSRPTYWLLLDMVPLHWRCRDQYVTSPAITPCPDLRAVSAVARSGGQGWPVFGPPLQRRAASLTAASTTACSIASGLRSPTIKPSKAVRKRPSKKEQTLKIIAVSNRTTIEVARIKISDAGWRALGR